MSSKALIWPTEFITPHADTNPIQLEKNSCLDFHGNPITAKLCVLSDGNHHKALLESLEAFKKIHPDVDDIFFITAPPAVLLSVLESGFVTLGHLTLSVAADVFISPPGIMKQLINTSHIKNHEVFATSKHNSLLVNKKKTNKINSIFDLTRKDITLAISNPETEKASYAVYSNTLKNFGKHIHRTDFLDEILQRSIFSQNIHHREIPEIIYNGKADIALLYHHLAKSFVDRFPDNFILIEYTNDYPDIDEITEYHVSIVNENNCFAEKLRDFLLQEESREIYQANGLASPTTI